MMNNVQTVDHAVLVHDILHKFHRKGSVGSQFQRKRGPFPAWSYKISINRLLLNHFPLFERPHVGTMTIYDS